MEVRTKQEGKMFADGAYGAVLCTLICFKFSVRKFFKKNYFALESYIPFLK